MRVVRVLSATGLLWMMVLSGCISPETDTPAVEAQPQGLPAVGSLDLHPSEEITLDVQGSGWGRIELNATADMKVDIHLEHESMQDLSIFSRDGEGTYDERNYTMIYLFPSDSHPWFCQENHYYFEWWGASKWAVWPTSSSDWEDCPNHLELGKGDKIALVAANTVSGYNITLIPEDATAQAHREWVLGPEPGHNLLVPEPEEDSMFENELLHVQRERTWSAQAQEVPASLVYSKSWTLREDTTVRAGTTAGSLGAYPNESCTGPEAPILSIPAPDWSVILDGHHYTARTSGTVTQETCDYSFERTLTENYAGVENVEEGAAFMTIPYQRPET